MIKHPSKNNIEFKVGFGICIFSIFDWYLNNFGSIWAPKKRSSMGYATVKLRSRMILKRYPHSKSFQYRLGIDLKRFGVQKLSQNQSKSKSVFDCDFWSIFHSKFCFTSKPRTSKINKNLLVFFTILGYSACYKLS